MRYGTVILLSLCAVLLGTGSEAKPPASPQPRPRLVLTPEQAAAPARKAAPETGIVTLDRMTVTESRLPASVPRRRAPDPTRFTWQRGGPLAEGKLGGAALSLGFWAKTDLFPEETAFAEPRAQVEFELVRVKR